MPHVIVKLASGRSEEMKQHLSEAITKSVIDVLHIREESLSVAIEDIQAEDWTEKVYKPDIQGKWKTLSKKPGYDPFK
jgi:4-oxalocrotonate tautomerase